MGTRSLTFVYDGNKPIVNMYRQYDGYPSGHGQELAEFLVGGTVVNGYGSHTPKKAWNGMGCLAASLIANFKESRSFEFANAFLASATHEFISSEFMRAILTASGNFVHNNCRCC